MRARLILIVVLAAVAGAGPASALDLTLPDGAVLTREIREDPGSYVAPVGPFADGVLPGTEIEGAILSQAWRVEAPGKTSLQILEPLREQIAAAGYEVVFECQGQSCGGFDFRFNIRVMSAPDLFVDLFDYRFLTARRAEGQTAPDYVTVLVSRPTHDGYIQIIRALPEGAGSTGTIGPGKPTVTKAKPSPEPLDDVAEALMEQGHVILGDLEFESGSASLGTGPYATLESLAAFLRADGSRRVALVGHTDTVGGLDANIALSRRRATSVMERLAGEYGIPRAQLEAEGMGYLAPVAPNRTQEGREANRRVEAVLLNTE